MPAVLRRMSSADSSNVTNTPGSPALIPSARNWAAKTVLPLPGVPVTSVVRPADRPPLATRSKPGMRVASLGTVFRPGSFFSSGAHEPCGPGGRPSRGRSLGVGSSAIIAPGVVDRAGGRLHRQVVEVEAVQHLFDLRQVADDAARGNGRFFDERGRGEDA